VSSRTTLIAVLGAFALALGIAPAAGAKAKTTTCDTVDPRACLLPWPNNHFTTYNIDTETRRQVRLPAATPKNVDGQRIDPFPYTLSDGFSPGGPILTFVPRVDLAKTGAVPQTDLRSYDAKNAPIVLIDAQTRKRQLIWAELDAAADKPSDRLLMIHPAKNLVEGRRYIVALRNLKDSSGRTLKAGSKFLGLRSGRTRNSRYASIFRTLGKHGIARSSLYLAWDFTVASQRNISERIVAARDSAFAVLGDPNLFDRKVKGVSPAFKVDAVQEFGVCGADGCQAGENDNLARRVTGTLTTACFLDEVGCPAGSKFRFRKRQGRFGFAFIPRRLKGNTMQTPFVCIVPRIALTRKTRPALYGHGLLGSPDDVMAPAVQAMAQEYAFVFCSLRQAGMSDQDSDHLRAVLRDASRFPEHADRVQQGLLNALMLGRAMIHSKGLVTHPAFQFAGGGPLLDTQRLYYDGTGQGGNFGTVLTALAPDFQRAVLGSTGMRYSLMIPRSIELDAQNAALAQGYPDRVTRNIVLAMLQGLWDRAEANGYAARITGDPPPNTPIHDVLLQTSVGDHQIPQISSEILARTAEMTVRQPVFDPGRSPDKIPFFDVLPTSQLELESGLVMWDSGPIRDGGLLGTDLPPIGGLPPRSGRDPHGLVQMTVAARAQKSAFLMPTGRLLEVCPERRACRVDGYPY